MSEPPEEGTSSAPPTRNNAQPGFSGSRGTGFYDAFRSGKKTATPSRPSFLEQSTAKPDTLLPSSSKQRDVNFHSVSKSNSKLNDFSFRPNTNSTPVLPVASFGSLKRKRPEEVVEKPSFKVSEFIKEAPRLPSFGTSLTKAKFDFKSNRSMFYSGRTKFGGSSSVREESAKRIKISPVSKGSRNMLTQLSSTKHYSNDHRTLTSKTAENILKTLNKIVLPQQVEKQPQRTQYASSFASLSKRLREKRKNELSLPRPPIERLNQIKSVQVSRSEVTSVPRNEPESTEVSISEVAKPESENEEVYVEPSNELKNVKKSTEDVAASVLSKNGLKMKRQRATAHYTASEKVEEPVNTMPEVTSIEPMFITELPKFDMKVKPAPAPMFTPIMKPAKAMKHVKSTDMESNEFLFSSPKTVSDKDIAPNSLDQSFSFISPVAVKNTESSFVVSKKVDVAFSQQLTKPLSVLTPVKETSIDEVPKEVPKEELPKPKCVPAPFPGGLKLSKPAEGSWECPTCMILNKPDCLKCVACTESKPGSKSGGADAKPSFLFGQTTVTIASAVTEPAFGKTSLASSTFSVASTNVSASTGFTFSKPFSAVTSAGFSFGVSSAVTTSECKAQPVKSETFSFGAPTDNSVKACVNMGTLPDLVNSVDDKPLPSIFGKPAVDIFGKPAADVSGTKPNPFAALNAAVKEGSWECPSCMIQNAPDSQKCVACMEAKPGSSGGDIPATNPPGDTKSDFKFGVTDSSLSGKFSFGAAQASDAPSSGFTFGKASSDTGFSFGAKSETPTKSNSIFEKLKPPAGSWSCPVCMVNNAADSAKCVACTEPKPGGEDAEQPPSNPEEPAAKKSLSNSFTFGSSSKPKEEISFKAAAASSNPFLKIKKPEGSWDCPTCMISNTEDCLKCVACTEAKPGSKDTVISSDQPEKNNSEFSFGVKDGGTTSGFSFGTNSETKSGFSFGAKDDTKGGFSFGTKDDKNSAPSFGTGGDTKSEFSFGTKSASSGSSGFSFIPQPDVCSSSSNGTSSFSFVPSMPSIPSTGSATASDFSFGKSTSNSSGFTFGGNASGTSGFSFNAVNSNANSENEGKPPPPSIFGNQSAETGQTITNGPTLEPKEVVASSGFNFGAASNNTGTFSFGALNNNHIDNNKVTETSAKSASVFSSVQPFDTSTFNGTAAAALPTAPPQFNFNSSSANVPSFLSSANDSKAPEPAKFNFTPNAAPNFNFGAATNAAAVFGNPTPSGQFSFTNNNNNNDGPKVNAFSQPPTGANLFTIGGGGTSDTSHNNTLPSGRKVKRAHRKLGNTRR